MKGKVHIVGNPQYGMAKLFITHGYWGVSELKDADIVVFQGGADINPQLYGEKPIRGGGEHFDKDRDEFEAACFEECVAQDKFMVGICRGSQFLNTMNGGSLWQDVKGHTGSHQAYDALTSLPFQVTSTHHQMMIPNPKPSVQAQVLMTAHQASVKRSEKYGTWSRGLSDKWAEDIESVWYPLTRSFCFQPHPEYPNCPKETVNWFIRKLEDLQGSTIDAAA